jgi:uncharacterized protein (TIGR02001 family)
MKKTFLALSGAAAVLVVASGRARAEDPPASPLDFHAGVFSDYRYRGISQTRLKPALQGGLDYASPSAFHVGVWASSIKWIQDSGGNANVELDLYGGYKGEIVKDALNVDPGLLQYGHPNAKTSVWNTTYTDPNTTELYGALMFGPATLKYAHSVSTLFGYVDSKNSGCLDASASVDGGSGLMLAPHFGYHRVTKNGDFSDTDYAFTASKDFSGPVLSEAIGGSSTKNISGSPAYVSPDGKTWARLRLSWA